MEADVRRVPARARGADAASRSCPFDAVRDYDEYVDGKPRYDGVASFLASRGIELPEGTPDDPPGRRDGRRPRQPQERARARADPRAGRRAVRGLGALRRRRRATPGCDARSSPRAPTASEVLDAAGIARPVRGTRRRRRRRARAPARASPRRTRSSPARGRSASSRAQAAVFEDALAGVEAGPGRALRLRRRRRPRRPGRRAARARRRRRRRRPGRAARAPHDPASGVRGRAVGAARDRARPRRARADRVGVRALQRPHRPARQPRRGRAARPAGHLPERLLRAAPAAVRRGRLRLPGVRPDDRQRHQRQDHPPAGRRRAVRRPLRRAARATSACSTCAPACCAATVEWVSPAGAAVRVTSTRLVSFAQRAIAAIRYEVEPLDGAAAGRRPVGAGRQRAAARRESAIRARPRRSTSPLAVRASHAPTTPRAVLVHSTKRERAAHGGRRWTTSIDGPDGTRHDARELRRTSARVTVAADARARAARCGSSSSSPTAGRAQRSLPALRDQVAAALAEAQHTGWDGLARRAARVPRRLLGRAPTSRSTATPSSSRRCASRCSTCSRPARAAEQRAIPAKGLTGPGYDGHTFWDTETLRPAGAHLHRARRRRATRCAGATRRSTSRASARAQLGLRGRRVPVAHDPRRGVLGLLAGRHRRVPHQRRHRRRRRPLPGARPTTRSSSARSASSCWSRPRGCGARSATTTPHGQLPHRRRHRPRRVQRDRRQQRLHQPDGAAEPARAPPTRAERHPDARARARRRRARRRPRWRDAAEAMRHPVRRGARRPPAGRGLHRARARGTSTATQPDQYPLLLHFPYFDLYRKQVVKQADLVLAMHLRGDAFTAEEKARNFDYYERADRARLVAVGLHPGGRSRPRSATSSSPTTTSARRR